jgi:hypothetical protein
MKTKITFVREFNTAFLFFHNTIVFMAHAAIATNKSAKARAEAIRRVTDYQASVEEALEISPPNGYVFAGVDEMTQTGDVLNGFRKPNRKSKEEQKTDAKLGKAEWLLCRLSTGLDATFVPIKSDWQNEFASPQGSGARIMQPHQILAAMPVVSHPKN